LKKDLEHEQLKIKLPVFPTPGAPSISILKGFVSFSTVKKFGIFLFLNTSGRK
jgi:hypothetical protein